MKGGAIVINSAYKLSFLYAQFTTIVCPSFYYKKVNKANNDQSHCLPNRQLFVKSVTDTKLFDKSTVSLNVLVVKIYKKVSSVTYHLQKTTA